jgi:hypothetical protein
MKYELFDSNGNLVEQRDYTKEELQSAWIKDIEETDKKIPRAIEDIIDALDASTKAKIAKETLDAYSEKKLIRTQKPK